MSVSKQRREAAQKRARKKRMTKMAVCATGLVVAVIAVIIYMATRPDSRVFEVPGGQSVVLFENGRFVAQLFHNTEISGTFIEDTSGSVTTISFTHGGNTVSTQIENIAAFFVPVQFRISSFFRKCLFVHIPLLLQHIPCRIPRQSIQLLRWHIDYVFIDIVTDVFEYYIELSCVFAKSYYIQKPQELQ